jgi:acyl-[acyl carrier protein]--UDP-N-acetylglucosamine O-acyltransferase
MTVEGLKDVCNEIFRKGERVRKKKKKKKKKKKNVKFFFEFLQPKKRNGQPRQSRI